MRSLSVRVCFGLGVIAALVAGGLIAFEPLGARAIVLAPNHGKSAPPALPGELRVRVGPPDAELAVTLMEPSGAPRGVIFVLHGIRSKKESMRDVAQHLVAAGYRAVLVDSRGHGRSTGDWLTYGVQEARDLSQLLDALHVPADTPVGAIGTSYGAATALEWAGREPRVGAAVALAPFSSLRDVVPIYARRMIPIVGSAIPSSKITSTIDAAGRMAGFEPDDASPFAAVVKRDVPILVFHGSLDDHIPIEQSRALVAHAPTHSTLIVLDGQDHDHIPGDARLWPAVTDFFSRSFAAH